MRVDPSYITNLVSSLDQTQANEQQLSSELSSGVSITSLSQNPVGSGENVLLLNQIQQDDSFTQSSSLVTGQLQVADSALGSVVSELTQAISLATSANNGTMSASDVESVGNQISGILDEVQSLANTSYQGQYIFAGGQTDTAPFATSTASSPAVTTYNGDEDVNYLEMPNGQKIQLNVPGDQIFLGSGTEQRFWGDECAGGRLFERHSQYCAGGERYGGIKHGAELRFRATREHRQLHHADQHGIERSNAAGDADYNGADRPDAGGPSNCFHATLAGRDAANGSRRCDCSIGIDVEQSVQQAAAVTGRFEISFLSH